MKEIVLSSLDSDVLKNWGGPVEGQSEVALPSFKRGGGGTWEHVEVLLLEMSYKGMGELKGLTFELFWSKSLSD